MPAQRLARLTHWLCSFPSVTGNEAAICDALVPWAERVFPNEHRRIGHTLVLGHFEDPRPTVTLFGHLDTVPGVPGAVLSTLQGEGLEGRVVGLGSSDMKGGDAVMMALAEDLDRATLPVNLALVLYEREEGPYDENGLGPVFGAMPEITRTKLAIALEGTDLDVQVGCVGSMHALLTFRGKRAHSARPWQGANAIQLGAELLGDLQARERRRVLCEGYEFFEVMSATTAHGGTARNVVPDTFEVNVNFRFAPGRTLEEAEAELRAFVGARAEVTIIDRSPAGRVCTANPLFQSLLRAAGGRATPKQAWTDVGRLSAHGIDAVNYGPGLTTQAHQAGEWVPVAHLVRVYEGLKTFLTSPLSSG